ncbi:MAG: glutamate--tRNA ligase [Minisyncoccia bacterium]
MKDNKNIVLRFPPSPTGPFHIGNTRTALYNYFYAKQNGGKLLFRLEDTDRERSKEEYSLDIIEGLKWLKIDIDFNNVYKQSEHSNTYRKYLEKLITEEKAYISKEEPKEEGQRSEVIRLKNPGKKVIFEDIIRGEVEVDTTELGDFVIAKSMDEPIYHLAVVIDDFEMGITHIMRGEDGIYNTPRQILIQEALGFTRPIYAHIPFILNADKSKLSKRNQGESVSLKYYRENGFLPEALINFLAFIGWNPGGEREIYSMDELIEKFDIKKVQKSGGIFNLEKLLWFNKEYIKKLPKEKVKSEIKKRLPADMQDERILEKITPMITERINVWSDVEKMLISGDIQYYFVIQEYTTEILVWKKGGTKEEAKENLTSVKELLKNEDEELSSEKAKELLWGLAEKKGMGNVLWPTRVALSGKEKSPDPFTLINILGKTETIKRIDSAIEKLS